METPRPAAAATRIPPPDVQRDKAAGVVFDFYHRLGALGETARRDCDSATANCRFIAWVLVAASIVLIVGGLLASAIRAANPAQPPLPHGLWRSMFHSLYALQSVLYSGVLAYAILRVATLAKLYPYYYRRAWQQLVHQDLAWAFTNADFHLIISQAVAQSFIWGSPKLSYRRFEQYLSFCACYISSLLSLAHGPRRLNRWVLAQEIQLVHLEPLLNQALWVYIAAGVLLGHIATLLGLLILQVAPRYIISRAYLTALLDYYRDEPQIDIDQLPPPEVLTGWWAQQTAPWRYRYISLRW